MIISKNKGKKTIKDKRKQELKDLIDSKKSGSELQKETISIPVKSVQDDKSDSTEFMKDINNSFHKLADAILAVQPIYTVHVIVELQFVSEVGVQNVVKSKEHFVKEYKLNFVPTVGMVIISNGIKYYEDKLIRQVVYNYDNKLFICVVDGITVHTQNGFKDQINKLLSAGWNDANAHPNSTD